MTTDQTPDPDEAPVDDPSPGDAPEQPEDTGESVGKREMRRRAQEAETERDALSARLDALTRQAIEGLIPEAMPEQPYGRLTMHRPSDLWAIGALDPANLMTPEGTVDTEALTAALTDLSKTRPYLFSNQTALHDAMSRQTRSTASGPASFGEAIRDGHRAAVSGQR